jgi:hypothetical protein
MGRQELCYFMDGRRRLPRGMPVLTGELRGGYSPARGKRAGQVFHLHLFGFLVAEGTVISAGRLPPGRREEILKHR